MKETSKMYEIRKARGDFENYLKGDGIDIGSGNDPLRILNGTVREWDIQHGDAALMGGVPNDSFDFIYSSHCLEHMENVEFALRNWVRILKPGCWLYVVVPDFILYEKCCFPPSRFNGDHKNTFSLCFDRSNIGRETHYGYEQMRDIYFKLGVDLVTCQVECNGYDFRSGPEIDQTLGDAVAQILFLGIKMR